MGDIHQLRHLADVMEQLRQMPERMLSEEICIGEARGRVLGHDHYAPEDLPHFSRATLEGYAVSALDLITTGGERACLSVKGEVRLGEASRLPLASRTTMKVSVGGMLPPGADAVIPTEQVLVGEGTIEVLTAVVPGEHVIPIGSDLRAGAMVLPKGHLLRPQDIGILAALGFDRIYVFRKPKVAILSMGDEVVEITEDLRPGKVRDLNTYTLSALVDCNNGIPVPKGIIPDDRVRLRSALEEALTSADLVLVSGISSCKTREWFMDLLAGWGQLLCSGIAVIPGQSTFVARVGQKMVFGLPGYPVSAMIMFELLVKPYLDWILNRRQVRSFPLKARITCDIASDAEYDEYFRVRVMARDGEYWAAPIPGESALISTLVQADGLVCISHNKDGLKAGDVVEVTGISGGYF